MSAIELVIPADADFLLRVRVDASVDAPTLSMSAASAPGWPVPVEKMLRRFESNGKTRRWSHREVSDHLAALGFQPDPPKTGHRPYIRWTVDGKVRSVTLYQEGSGLVVDSGPLLPFALTLAGARPPTGKHPKIKWSYSTSTDAAIDAAGALRAHADAWTQ